MALEEKKWRIVDGPNRWDLVFLGLIGQEDLTFVLTPTPEEGGKVRKQRVTAVLLEMGPAKCPYVTHPSDRSQDEWVVLLIFRDGPFKDQYHSFYYDSAYRKGFMTERPYIPYEPGEWPDFNHLLKAFRMEPK